MSKSYVLTGIAAVSTTAQNSDEESIQNRANRENMQVEFNVGSTETAWTMALEGRYWEPEIDYTFTTAAADLATWFAAELTTALGRAPAVGDMIKVGSAFDTTDAALDAAKGSAPADGDIFMVSDIGTEAVVYVANEGFQILHTALTQASTVRAVQVPFCPRVRAATSGTWTASVVRSVTVHA